MPLPNHQPKRKYIKHPKFVPLNFLRIPYLAQKKIVAQINPLDSVHFSLNCERYRQVLLKAKVRTNILNYQFTNENPKLRIEQPDGYITVMASSFTQPMRAKKQPTYRLSGVRTEMEIHKQRDMRNTFTVTLKVRDPQENAALDALKLFTYHLLEFLLPSKVMVHYNRPFLLNNVLHWNHVPKYHQVEIGHQNAIEGFTEAERHFLLEKVKMKHLSLHYVDSVSSLVPSLQRWLADENIEYQVDQVSFYANVSHEEFLNICDSLNAVPTGFTEANIISTQPVNADHCIRGTQRDISRESDGKSVTIIYYRPKITLLFWNQGTLKAAGRL